MNLFVHGDETGPLQIGPFIESSGTEPRAPVTTAHEAEDVEIGVCLLGFMYLLDFPAQLHVFRIHARLDMGEPLPCEVGWRRIVAATGITEIR